MNEKAFQQLANLVLALSKALAHTQPDAAKAFIGAAIYASRQDGSGDEIAIQVWGKCFPGQPLPTVVSSDIMDTLLNKSKS
ncbi:hypothetical protein [Azorhizophilus paspali]|uniref:Uncharacterized protein n=1 Tax=Azorhizophilus paspali TaxID=69963 RepID=A0ABV6SMH3_AZOPA